MVLEAQRDNVNRAGRMVVTAYLVQHYDWSGNSVVMASMGSLAHYIQDLSAYGFHIRNFLHEGNGDLWVFAVEQAASRVCGLDSRRRKGRRRRRALPPRAGAAAVLSGIRARSGRRRRRALSRDAGKESLVSRHVEAEMYCCTRCPAGQVDLLAQEALVDATSVSRRLLPSSFGTYGKGVAYWKSGAKDDHRTDRRPARPEVARQNVEVLIQRTPQLPCTSRGRCRRPPRRKAQRHCLSGEEEISRSQ